VDLTAISVGAQGNILLNEYDGLLATLLALQKVYRLRIVLGVIGLRLGKLRYSFLAEVLEGRCSRLPSW